MTRHETVPGQVPAVSEEQQQVLLDFAVAYSPVIYYIAPLSSTEPVRFISANVESITGHSQNAFTTEGGYGWRLVHPDDYEGYTRSRAELRETGQLTLEYRFRCKDGGYKWFRDDIRLAGSDATGGAEIVGCMIDISEQKQAEAERARASRLFTEAVESLNSGLSITDADGKVIACNAALMRNLELAREAIVGQPRESFVRHTLGRMASFDGIPVEQSEQGVARIVERLSDGDAPPIEVEFKDGRWVLLNNFRISDGGIVTVSTNITTIKDAERELRDSERQFRALVEQNPLPICLTELGDGRVAYASPAAASLLARDWPLQAELTASELWSDSGAGEIVLERSREGRPLRDFEMRLRRADGTDVWVALSSRPIEYRGRPAVIMGFVELTERKRREAELMHAEEALRQRDRLARLLVENHPSPVWMVEVESGRILYESLAAAEMTEREWGTGDQHRVGEFYADPEARDRFVADLRANRVLRNYEIQFRRKDGSTFWVSANSRLIEHDGRELHITGWLDLTERREREEALKRAHEMLEDAVEALSEGFVLYDAEDRLVLCNEQFKRYNEGVSDLFVPGRTWQEITRERLQRGQFPNAIGREEEWLREQLALRGNITSEEFPVAGGRWFEHSHRRTRQGGLVLTWREVTERRDREEALRRAHETLEDAVTSLSEGFALYDSDDRLVMCNERYREYNARHADILKPGMRFADLIETAWRRGDFATDRSAVDEWIDNDRLVKSSNRAVEGYEFLRTDGRWFSYSSQPTRQGGTVVTLAEITHRKEMERALRESEAGVRQLLEASPVPLTLSRMSDGTIVYESPTAQQLFGSEVGSDYGSALNRWSEPELRPVHLEELRRSGSIDNVEVEYRRRDGSTFWAALSAKLIELMGEEMIVSSAFDLTERRAVEEEMARHREALHQSEKMGALGQLLASVAHELNNPLSVLVGQAVLLKETVDDPKVRARADRIGTAADRCARIVRTFLAMARQQPRESVPTEANSLIETALEVTGYALRASGIEVSAHLGRDLPPVLVDPDQMAQVFTNLIVNAEQALRDYPGPRKLRLTTRYLRQSKQVVFKIKDNGAGIPEHIRRRIFEPFFTTKEIGKGTGIGLAIVHRILETHGGKIKVEDTPGSGATFVIRLPVQPESIARADADAEAGVAVSGLSILVLDDEVEVAELVAEVLSRDGHDVAVAHSGAEGLSRISERDFDIVLSDFRMPNIDGQGLFNELERSRPDMIRRLGFMTGDKLSADVSAFLQRAGRPHIEKPILPDDLRDLIRRVIDDGGRKP